MNAVSQIDVQAKALNVGIIAQLNAQGSFDIYDTDDMELLGEGWSGEDVAEFSKIIEPLQGDRCAVIRV